MQDVSAFRVNEMPGHVKAGTIVAHAVTHGERAGIDGAETHIVPLDQHRAFIVPELNKSL